ncbi:hypothetical protein VIGAN_03210500 [Vigna angularis var. angularis]|uniref:Uncharacterized protein n=1 Tax=Vigna angularis var. angularis TaxID=157739 RepID=A0A0S3RNH3_PHAAN|nr:hypothetical protein VIGAN_03210500 [Vigna angularis var. angularis]
MGVGRAIFRRASYFVYLQWETSGTRCNGEEDPCQLCFVAYGAADCKEGLSSGKTTRRCFSIKNEKIIRGVNLDL